MSNVFNFLTGVGMHAYSIACFLAIIRLVAQPIFNAFEGKRPL